MTFLAASPPVPAPAHVSPNDATLIQDVTIYSPKLGAEEGFTMYPTPISSCPVPSGKNAFCGAITHSPWMKYWRHHIAFLSCSFKPSLKELSFRKSCWHAFFCLLSQIQRLSVLTVAWFCVHIKTHVFFIPAQLQGNAYTINHFPQRNSVCSSGLWKESHYLTSRQCRLIKAGIFKLIYNKKHLALNI